MITLIIKLWVVQAIFATMYIALVKGIFSKSERVSSTKLYLNNIHLYIPFYYAWYLLKESSWIDNENNNDRKR
jgi:hypothetical protein